ncbi:hypothetical protein POM88_008498 [Heracleum sosnowskyi]|uniref:NTF2 domain-containing protein n=1 Tax=Heracleum sosnowskyi TaxID=360622 RepID=A0AAD8J9Z3_9APIA|nr:hypothetical protein POM88_008498 [Heracleum sosnowskyi]
MKAVHAQHSIMGSVIVGVTETLTDKENIKMKFAQIFFLAPQESDGFYVRNDILHLLDVDEPNVAFGWEVADVVNDEQVTISVSDPSPMEAFEILKKSSTPTSPKKKSDLLVKKSDGNVPEDNFKKLSYASVYDLELVFVKNNHVFVDEYMKKPDYIELMRRLGALGDGNKDQSTLSPDEWEVAYLYLAYVLRKRGQPEQTRTNSRKDRGKMHIMKEDITYMSS